jgi:hypothetical protein
MPSADDLQRLLAARYDWEHADIEEKPEREKFYNELFGVAFRETVAVRPSTSRHTFRAALDVRYFKYRGEDAERKCPIFRLNLAASNGLIGVGAPSSQTSR